MRSQFTVDGDTAIVTGASSGIGKAIAERFVDEGVNVVINSRSQERVDTAAEDIRSTNPAGEILPIECDVRSRDQVFELVEETVETFGGLDILVNNAAGLFSSPFEDLSENAWKTILDINLNGIVHCSQAAGEILRESGGGYIVNISSGAGHQGGSPGSAHYGASKAAMNNLTQSLAREWDSYGIRVNCISPGLIGSPFQLELRDMEKSDLPPRSELDRSIGHPEEVADVAQFLCSPAASFISGQIYRVNIPTSQYR